MRTCSTCGQTIKAPAKPRAGVAPAILTADERAALTDPEFRAYCASVAPLQDAEFFARYGVMAPDIRAALDALIGDLRTRAGRPADRARLVALKDAARRPGASWRCMADRPDADTGGEWRIAEISPYHFARVRTAAAA